MHFKENVIQWGSESRVRYPFLSEKPHWIFCSNCKFLLWGKLDVTNTWWFFLSKLTMVKQTISWKNCVTPNSEFELVGFSRIIHLNFCEPKPLFCEKPIVRPTFMAFQECSEIRLLTNLSSICITHIYSVQLNATPSQDPCSLWFKHHLRKKKCRILYFK